MSKRALITVVSLVLVLGAAVGVGVYFLIQLQSLSHPPEETARFLPAETSLYVSMNLRPGSGQLMKARDILDLFKENPRFEEKVDELYGDLEEETGIDVEQELFPWLGPEIAFAFPTFEGIEEEPEIMAFIGHTDEVAAESFLRKLMVVGEETGETEYEETLTRGHLTFVVDPSDDVSVHVVLADDYIVVATGAETLDWTLDRMDSGGDQARSSLFDDPGFQEAREAAESPRFGLMYVDVAGIVDQVGGEVFDEEIVDSVQDFSDQLPDFIVVSSSFIDRGILVSTSFDYPVQDQLFVPAVANEVGSAGLLSEDTVALLSFVGVQDGWDRLRDELTGLPDLDLDDVFDEIESEIGIDIEGDILGWMTGEVAFALLLPGGVSFSTDEIHANAYVEFEDRAKALSGMERIRRALEEGGVEFDVVDIEGNEAVVADVGEEEGIPNLTPGYVVLDDYVVVGTTLTSLRQAVEAGKGDIPSLRESTAFSRPLEAVGGSTDFMVYGNIRRIVQEALDQVEETELAEYRETAEPFVAPLEAFLLGLAVEEELVTLSAVITFSASADAQTRKAADARTSAPTATPFKPIPTTTPEPVMPEPTAVTPDHADCTRPDDALPSLILDEPTHGNIDHAHDVDCFTFTGNAGQAYQIDVALGSLEDSVLAVYGGNYMESNDDFGDSTASRITFAATVSATYYVEVSGWGGSTGSYTVSVEAVSEADSQPTPTAAALRPTPIANSGDEQPLRIGVMASVTGPGETYGTPLVQAKRMAQDEINHKGGINGRSLEFIVEDSKCNAQDAINAYNKLTDMDGVKIILGPTCSGALLGVAPLAEEEGVLLFSPSATNPDIADAGDYIFRTALSDTQLNIDTGNALWADGVRELAAFTENDGYADWVRGGIIAQFEKMGGEIVAGDSYSPRATDFKGQLTKLLHAGPDAVLITAYSQAAGGTIVKQLREIGYDGPVYANAVLLGTTALHEAGEAATGLKVVITEIDPASSNGARWRAIVLTHFWPEEFGLAWYIGSAYDSVYIAAECLKRTNDDQDADGFRDCMYDITWSGAIGDGYSFDDRGEVTGVYHMVVEVLPVAERTEYNLGYEVLGPAPALAPASHATQDSSADRAALVALYNDTDGPQWTNNAGWRSEASLGEWFGVTTDSSGRVAHLNLHDNQLSEEIPPKLGSLTSLESLDLSLNKLTGSIPPEMGSLANPQWLALYNNQLTGEIPSELGSLANLQELHLRDNHLTGEIPASIGDLTNLEGLWLFNNRLTGAIPAELGSLSNLRELSLYGNQLSGEVPPDLGNLSNLGVLTLRGNQLTGCVPSSLKDQLDMNVSDLGGQEFCPSVSARSFVSVSAGWERTCGVKTADSILGDSAMDRLAKASYQFVLEGTTYRERLSLHRTFLGQQATIPCKGGDWAANHILSES